MSEDNSMNFSTAKNGEIPQLKEELNSQNEVLQIANDFVRIYLYALLHSPDKARMIYGKPSSKFDHPVELKGIKSMFSSPTYTQCRVQINSVNAQESTDSGIFVLVTGLFIAEGTTGNLIRSFTQALHLAPQTNKDFYVLNDILQYVDNANSESSSYFNKKLYDLQEKIDDILVGQPPASTSCLPERKFADIRIDPDPCSGRSLENPIGRPNEQLLAIGREWRESAYKECELVFFYTERQRTSLTIEEQNYALREARSHERSADDANQNASKILFATRSSVFNNRITIDLRGQIAREAKWIVKEHLKYCTLLRSVQFLTVIIGYESQTDGMSMKTGYESDHRNVFLMKLWVTDLLKRENVEWKEVESDNYTLEITIDKDKVFSFFKPCWVYSYHS